LATGPFAVLCSGPAAIIGGTIGWFAVDKILIETDKYYNADTFKEDLKIAIDDSKSNTKKTLYDIYKATNTQLTKETNKKFEELKNKPIKNIIDKS
jgi:hypothetical protein